MRSCPPNILLDVAAKQVAQKYATVKKKKKFNLKKAICYAKTDNCCNEDFYIISFVVSSFLMLI